MSETSPATDLTTLRLSGEQQGDIPVRANNDWVAASLIDRVWPVGSIFMSKLHTTADAVAEALGGGTWTLIGAGKVIVGLDSSDTDFDAVTDTGGAKTHSGHGTHTSHTGLSHTGTAVGDHAAHHHDAGAAINIGGSGGGQAWNAANSSTDHGPQSHSVTQPTAHADQTHSAHTAASNMPPFIVRYLWERVS